MKTDLGDLCILNSLKGVSSIQLKSYHDHDDLRFVGGLVAFLLHASARIDACGQYEFDGCVAFGNNLFVYQLDRINGDINATIIYCYPCAGIAADMNLNLEYLIRSIPRWSNRTVYHVKHVIEYLERSVKLDTDARTHRP